METERIALSQRERDRLRVLHEVQQRHITQTEAGRRLQLSDRQVRRLLWRVRKQGDQAMVHGLRGHPSNRKLAGGLEQKILARVGQRYADFGPTLAAEHLAKEGLRVSRETLRKWMTKAAYYPNRISGQNHHACNSRFVSRVDKFGLVLARTHLHARLVGSALRKELLEL